MRAYGNLARQGDKWVVAELEPHVAIRFKANFPKVPRHSAGPWALPADGPTSADLSWFMSRYPLRAAPEHLAQIEDGRVRFEAVQAEVGRIMAPDYTPPEFKGLRPGQAVRLHQARAAELVARFNGLLVADDVGEGKTYTGGACLLLEGALPGTVVCPPHLRLQWADKLKEFTTLTTHIVIGTKPYPMPPADVRIFSYSNLAGWVDMLEMLGTGLAIFDEGHALRRGTESGGKAIAKGDAAMRLAETARMRLALTGTPIFNYGDELWNLMQFVRPEVLGSWPDFYREWCGGSRQVRDPDALGSYMREQNAMIRQQGKAPAPNVIVEAIGHDVQRLKSVEDVARHLALKARDGSFEERGLAIRELNMLLRMETGLAKAKAVAAYVRIIAEGGRPVILFGWHRGVYDIWLRELADLNPVLYTGSETPKQKEASKAAFLSGWSKVFIMSLRSGEGVDGLQAVCRTVVIGELDWSPAVHKQNIGRVNREGQACWPTPVDAIYLVADDGADPPMLDMLGLKASQAHGIVDPGKAVAPAYRDLSPLERLVQHYIDKKGGDA